MIIVFSLVGLGFFISIRFPTTFSLRISGLGTQTKVGAGIIMAIVGGALLPPLMGYLSDSFGSIQMGTWCQWCATLSLGTSHGGKPVVGYQVPNTKYQGPTPNA